MRTCQWCGTEITKRHGFWHMWRAVLPVAGDPEYCPVSRSHAHQPD